MLGGAGFIGSKLVLDLLSMGAVVRVLSRTSSSLKALSMLCDKLEIVQGDFQDEYILSEAMKGVDCVVHLITTTYPRSSPHSSVYDVSTNLIPTIRLLENCEKLGVSKLVYLSSGGTVYGEPLYCPIDEDHPLDPISFYGFSKKIIENYLAFFEKSSSLEICILRASNPYGPGQNAYGLQGIVAVAMASIVDRKPFTVLGDGSAVRDYLYIGDLSLGILSGIAHSGSVTANISSGQGCSVNQLLSEIECVSGYDIECQYLPSPGSMVKESILSNALALQVLNWRPTISLRYGLEETWRYFSS